MAKSEIPAKNDKVTATETKDITGKELLGTMPVGGPPDTSKIDAAAKLSGVDDPKAVRERGPVEIDPKPFDVHNVQDSGTGTFKSTLDSYPSQDVKGGQFTGGELKNGEFSTRDALTHNDLNAMSPGGNPTALPDDQPEPTQMLTLLDLDGRWAVRVQGVTIFLEPKSDFAGLPVPGMLQRVFGAINAAVSHQSTTSTRKDSPTINRDDASRKSEIDVANGKKKLEDSGVGA